MRKTDFNDVLGFDGLRMDMHGMLPEADVKKISKPETWGKRRNWFAGVEALHTVVRVLPPDLYDKLVSGYDRGREYP